MADRKNDPAWQIYLDAKRITFDLPPYTIQRRWIIIHPFADPDVIAGQGTIALEILQDLPDVDLLPVAIGGVSLAAK